MIEADSEQGPQVQPCWDCRSRGRGSAGAAGAGGLGPHPGIGAETEGNRLCGSGPKGVCCAGLSFKLLRKHTFSTVDLFRLRKKKHS